MSYKINVHGRDFQHKYLNQLKKGDILFTTTNQSISKKIRKIANLKISHCNLYTGPNKLIDSAGTVQERLIPNYFQNQEFTRVIAFQNKNLDKNTRKKNRQCGKKF